MWSWYGLKRLNGDKNYSLNIRIKMISGFKPMILWMIAKIIWESIWREMLPYKDIWTIKSYAGFESK